jgi:hypothetical protein
LVRPGNGPDELYFWPPGRFGFSTIIHPKTDLDGGHPIAFHLIGGEASDSRNFAVCSTSDPMSFQGLRSPTGL